MSSHDSAQPNDEPMSQRPLLGLSGRARDVLAVLAREDEEARALYESALRVLDDRENPRRVRLAACGLRELLDAFHEEKKGGSLGDRVKRLSDEWDEAKRSPGIAEGTFGSGFVQSLESFFVEYKKDYPGRKRQASDTIERRDPAQRTPQPAVRDARGRDWMTLSGYFSNVLHGKIRPTEAEFRAQLEALESFLLDWLRPMTFDDLSDMDDLIAEGPPGV
ncbi:MAG TPA: hypothetical protein VHY18_03425 [Solirubrobacteraceae bacterium]|jgi:hypothetical protein|nr:hypothetical protein [Solirubrobacteraceae bacterium]